MDHLKPRATMRNLMAAMATLAVMGLFALPGSAQQDRARDGKAGADRGHHADRDGERGERDDDREHARKRCGVTIRDILERHKESDRKPNPKLIRHLKEHFKRHQGDRCHCRCDNKCTDKKADEERNRRAKDGKRGGDDRAQRDGKRPDRPSARPDGKRPAHHGKRGGAPRR